MILNIQRINDFDRFNFKLSIYKARPRLTQIILYYLSVKLFEGIRALLLKTNNK